MNVGRKRRTIEEAIAIAEEYGAVIPDDVEFLVAQQGDLDGNLKDFLAGGNMKTARHKGVTVQPDGYVYWSHHFDLDGKIRFLLHPDILMSDEAIVAVFHHELCELSELRAIFMGDRRRRLNADDYGYAVLAGFPNNLHDQCWTAADDAVAKMREKRKC